MDSSSAAPATTAAPSDTGLPTATSTSAVFVADTTCANAGVGALWCAAKQKCLRAWEEACPQFGAVADTPVQVRPTPAAAPVVVVAAPPITPVVSGLTPPLYRPPPVYSQVPIYAQPTQPSVPQPALYAGLPASTFGLLGNGRDAFGCLSSGGYTWCASQNQCTRAWQTPCPAVTVNTQLNVALPGSQRDANGCVLGGGYSWCAALNTCVRSWETACPVTPAAPVPLIGGQTDAGGCVIGGGYSFCASLNRCVRVWETPCPA